MEIICHRGIWEKENEQNKLESFVKAFENGFGIEFDVRDNNSEIVISHDMPLKHTLKLEDLFDKYNSFKEDKIKLAINIKSDGLIGEIKHLISKYNINNYFTFDMSIPQMLRYKENNIHFYSRVSEYENTIMFKRDCKGIWLDSFGLEWYNNSDLQDLLNHNHKICVVSSELHGRENKIQWNILSTLKDNTKISLCTDDPFSASTYFI